MPSSSPARLAPDPSSGAQALQIQENVELAPRTTLGIGGPARFFAEIVSESQLIPAVDFARDHDLPLFILGGGSNLLVPDSGFNGLVLHAALAGDLVEQSTSDDHVDLIVPAGVPWEDLVLHACQSGLSGLECLAGIPGLTGGSPVQNIGAYGQEVADTILSVRAFDLKADAYADTPFVDLPRAACHFSYRSSLFNSSARGRFIVTSVTFRLSRSARPNLTYADLARHFANRATPPTPMDVYHAVREIRRSKGMLLVEGDPDGASAGSFFKNPIVPSATLAHVAAALDLAPAAVPHWPVLRSGHSNATQPGDVKLPAAWLVEQAGFHKGQILGRVGISSRHSLALINRGGASSADLIALRDAVQSEVLRRFGIQLEQEPVEPGLGTRLTSPPAAGL